MHRRPPLVGLSGGRTIGRGAVRSPKEGETARDTGDGESTGGVGSDSGEVGRDAVLEALIEAMSREKWVRRGKSIAGSNARRVGRLNLKSDKFGLGKGEGDDLADSGASCRGTDERIGSVTGVRDDSRVVIAELIASVWGKMGTVPVEGAGKIGRGTILLGIMVRSGGDGDSRTTPVRDSSMSIEIGSECV